MPQPPQWSSKLFLWPKAAFQFPSPLAHKKLRQMAKMHITSLCHMLPTMFQRESNKQMKNIIQSNSALARMKMLQLYWIIFVVLDDYYFTLLFYILYYSLYYSLKYLHPVSNTNNIGMCNFYSYPYAFPWTSMPHSCFICAMLCRECIGLNFSDTSWWKAADT